MSRQNSMRRYLRQDNDQDAPHQVGEIVFIFDQNHPIAFIAYDNGCKKVWSNDDPIANPGAYRWDCPQGVDPPVGAGGDRGIDDDYNGNDDDNGDTLIYECIQRKLCNESSPSDPSAEGGWEFKGVCDFEGGICPFPKYEKSQTYKRGDEVAVEVDRLLHECTNSNKCNDNVPSASSGGDVDGGDNGWKLFGGCKAGESCNAEEFDTFKAASNEYNGGDEVFTKIGRNYGTIGSSGGAGGGGAFGENVEGSSGGGGGGGAFGGNVEGSSGGAEGGGGFGEMGGGFKLVYQCVDKDKCNDTMPGDPSVEGWDLVGTCSTDGVCAPQFDTTDKYNLGDKVSVSVDRLIHECEDKSICNENIPGASSSVDDGWKLIGGCKAGRICNAVEFDTSKAANDEYDGGDEVFTRIGYDYGAIGGTGSSGGTEGGGGFGEMGGGFKLVYQCVDKDKCNDTMPGDPSVEGWDLVGTCGTDGVCAPQFDTTDKYNLGDKVSVSVDRLILECEDKSICNENIPGASSSVDDGWKLIGGCKAGHICNAVEFDTSRAANDEYDGGDEVFTRIGYDYGAIGDIIDSVYCPGSRGVDSSDEATKTLVTYAYEVETSQVTDANTFLPRLEGQILSNLSASMLSWCLKDERLRRRLEEYGVLGIESFPMDVPVTGGLCTYESAAADGCFAVDGGLTLSLNPGVDSEAAADATRALLEEAMTSNALLSPDIPEVVKVKYLGDSYDDYVDSLSGGQQAGPGATTRPENDITGTGTQGENKGLPIALIAVALVAIVLLALCCVKRRVDDHSKDELDTHGEDSDLEDDLDDVIDRIGGIGNQPQTKFANDPPGSFHMGQHHYTEDGVQYKSLSCAQCQSSNSTNATGILGRIITTQEEVNDLDLNDKNDLSFDLDMAKNFVDYCRNELGRTHSSINVRHCKSATCALCKKTGGVVFVKAQNEVEL
jgi:hypothetical protein